MFIKTKLSKIYSINSKIWLTILQQLGYVGSDFKNI